MLTRILIILALLSSSAFAQQQQSAQDQVCLTYASIGYEMSKRANTAEAKVADLQMQLIEVRAKLEKKSNAEQKP